MATSKQLRPSKGGAKRPPHNARLAEYESFPDLLAKAANEPKTAQIAGREVRLSRAERLFRMSFERALEGSPRDLTDILRRMIAKPALAASFREEITYYVLGDDADL